MVEVCWREGPCSVTPIVVYYGRNAPQDMEDRMRYNDYSHRHGKELLHILHPQILKEIQIILKETPPFPHGSKKGLTAKNHLTEAFADYGWAKEGIADFSTDKRDALDLCKWKVAIELEFSRFEMFFRDFFRFMLLYERREIDVGIIITLDEMAYEQWQGEVSSYRSARASLQRLVDFLKGDYASVVRVPLWCIGVE